MKLKAALVSLLSLALVACGSQNESKLVEELKLPRAKLATLKMDLFPQIFMLDTAGKVVFHQTGIMTEEELEAALTLSTSPLPNTPEFTRIESFAKEQFNDIQDKTLIMTFAIADCPPCDTIKNGIVEQIRPNKESIHFVEIQPAGKQNGYMKTSG
ncbi:MAG: hypothetical protein HRT35_05555 [Algicola sp.]|nr:hypothetical protein [Algicola sp.]